MVYLLLSSHDNIKIEGLCGIMLGSKKGIFFILMSVEPKFFMAVTAFVSLTTLVAMEEWSSSSVMGKNEIKTNNNGLFFQLK